MSSARDRSLKVESAEIFPPRAPPPPRSATPIKKKHWSIPSDDDRRPSSSLAATSPHGRLPRPRPGKRPDVSLLYIVPAARISHLTARSMPSRQRCRQSVCPTTTIHRVSVFVTLVVVIVIIVLSFERFYQLPSMLGDGRPLMP